MTGPAADVVILGASPTGLYALREAAACGLVPAVADLVPGCAHASRHVRGDPGRCFTGDLDGIARWLDRLAREFRGRAAQPLLVPTSDVFIEFVLERAADLASGFAFAGCYRGGARALLDKAAFHELCRRHDMATPRVLVAEGPDGFAALEDRLSFPCILKPVMIHRARRFLGGRKVLLAEDRDAFARHVDAMPDDSGAWLVQEIIPGPESEITLFAGYVDRFGVVRQAMTARKLRQYPPGFGSASLVTSQMCGETLELATNFLERIGFHGICGAEFKRDARDGRLKIIEINPRPTLWFQIAHDAGKRIVAAACRDLAGLDPAGERHQDPSVLWRYGLKDAAAAVFYRLRHGRFIFPPPDLAGAASMRGRSWPVWARDDRRPVLAEIRGYIGKARARR